MSASVTGAEGYTVYYKVGDGDWTTTVPTVTHVSEETVTVSVKAERTGYVTLEAAPVTIAITPKTVTLRSEDATKAYDGTPLTNHTVVKTGFVGSEGVTCTVTGSQLIAGSSSNTFTYVFNADTSESDYNVNKTEGTLTVTQNTTLIRIIAGSDSKIYDGTPLTKATYSLEGTLAAGDEIKGVTVAGTITDVGSTDNKIVSYTILHDGALNVTGSYSNVVEVDGTLTVNKRALTLTSSDAEKEYDGTPLTKNEVLVTAGSFADGEGAAYNVTGSQTDAGSSDNTFTYTLNGNTKADNYEITTVCGKLVVSKKTATIIITAGSKTEKYNGSALTEPGYTVTGSLAAGETVVAVTEGSITNVGTTSNAVKEYRIMHGDKDVTGNYASISTVPGTLTVTARKVIMTSASATKEYDSKPLTAKSVEVTGDGFVSGEGAEYDVTGSQIIEGSSDNTFIYELKRGTKEDNYDIEVVYGTLEVTNKKAAERIITVTAADDSKPFDREPLTNNTADVDDALLGEMDTLTYTVEAARPRWEAAQTV